jgi:hypothetical protein
MAGFREPSGRLALAFGWQTYCGAHGADGGDDAVMLVRGSVHSSPVEKKSA